MLSKFSRFTPLAVQQVRTFSRWAHVPMGPKDPILGVQEAFVACERADKLSFGVGAYRDDDGKPVVLPSVKRAQDIVNDAGLNNEYAAIVGSTVFNNLAMDLAYGPSRKPNTVALQALSGTGSLRLLAGYLQKNWNGALPTVLISNPSWGNHFPIFEHAGMTTQKYTYYDPSTIGLNFSGMCEDLSAAPDNSVVLLHATAHNPTGIDPT